MARTAHMKKLSGKTAVITGGTRGLGFAIAQAFVREDASVVVGSRSAESVERAVAALKAEGGRAEGLPCSVSRREDTDKLRDLALTSTGKIDIWINNAGLSCPTGPTAHIPYAYVKNLIDTNILGVYHGSLTAMRYFLTQNSGKLINISGKGEKKPFALHNPYASSKAWEHNFTLALAREYRDTDIGVFLFNPGVVDSDMLHRLTFIRGYEANIKIFKAVMGMLIKPPEYAAEKAVRLASSATDGRTGKRINLVGPGTMLKGMAAALGRKISGRKPPLFEVDINLVEPEISWKQPPGNDEP